MKREVIQPTSREHWLELKTNDVSSTESAALFGLSPYITHFELWHRKKSKQIVEIEANERMTWGTRLEGAIAAGIAEDHGLLIRKMNEYIRLSQIGMGSSFDYCVQVPMMNPTTNKNEIIDIGLLEIKNVDGLQFNNGWLIDEDGSLEAPPHIEIQVQHQLAVSGLAYAYIGALVGGNQVKVTKRHRDDGIIREIQHKVMLFWSSVIKGEEPTPDFTKDAEFISKLYGYAEPGKIIDPNEQITMLAEKYRQASLAAKTANELKDAAKAELLTLIGDAEKVKGDKFSISAGMIGPTRVEYDRAGYRIFKITWKKEKQNEV